MLSYDIVGEIIGCIGVVVGLMIEVIVAGVIGFI